MSGAAAAGGAVGGVTGGAIGGIIGSFIPPPGLGTFLGRAIGSRVGRAVGRAAATMLDDYVNSMEQADENAEEDEAAAAGEDEEVCHTCQEQCQNSAGEVKDSLYNNKRNPNNPNQGNHGYLNRMVEQMCGAQGPGTPGWGTHIDELRGAQSRLRRSFKPFQGQNGMDPDCDPAEFFSQEERDAINNILRGGENNPWQPNNIPHLGPNHPRCQTLPDARSNGRIRDYLNIIRPNQPPMSGPALS
ncbi:hypothetical protein [uncultured Tateyamaria sp.]|uniref:hypothetical protein n=1 Tax=uncultured Tateyamaria sp. TaxID=455651 RepID=UPI0026201064|nr:hypothetical protein [uncultured Tateyamaria sp.]